jgi:predicted nucleic acid-binding protein
LQTEEALAPALWWFELRNGLVVNERRGRITEQKSAEFLADLSGLGITIDRSPNEGRLMSLARRHRLTVYDAAYLELALREGLPLATLDALLAEAARQEGVAVLGDAA